MASKRIRQDLGQWLGNSYHYRNYRGEPQVLYHGTKKPFAEFRANLTPDDHVPGVSLTPDRAEAEMYGNAIPVHTRVRSPIGYPELERFAAERAGKTDDPDFAAFDVHPKQLAQWLKDAGHDAIDYTSDPMLGYGIRVLDPGDIRKVETP